MSWGFRNRCSSPCSVRGNIPFLYDASKWAATLDILSIRLAEFDKGSVSDQVQFSISINISFLSVAMDSYSASRASTSSVSLGSNSPPTSSEASIVGARVALPNIVNNQDFLPLDDSAQFVLVVGGLGFIGSHTTLELLKEGYNVIVVDDLSNSYGDVVSRVATLAKDYCKANRRKMPYLKFHHCDYRTSEMGYLLKQYDAPVYFSPSIPIPTHSNTTSKPRSLITSVIHFAAFKAVEESIQSPLSYYQNNVCGLVDFLVLLKQHNITNFVFSSSATVYGEKTNEGKPLRESDLVHHTEIHEGEVKLSGAIGLTSPYGRTKYFCEAILADVARADPTWNIVSPDSSYTDLFVSNDAPLDCFTVFQSRWLPRIWAIRRRS